MSVGTGLSMRLRHVLPRSLCHLHAFTGHCQKELAHVNSRQDLDVLDVWMDSGQMVPVWRSNINWRDRVICRNRELGRAHSASCLLVGQEDLNLIPRAHIM